MIKNKKTKIFSILFIILSFVFGFSTGAAGVTPNDPEYSKQWYLEQISAPEAWSYTKGSSDVVIAVMDSGVDTDHPDLKNNLWINPGEIPGDGIDNDGNGYADDYNGWDFVNDLGDPNPKISSGFSYIGVNHGTMVSSIASAVGGNSEGITGVSWNSKVMPLRVFDNKGFGDSRDVERAIDYAIDNGADILNMSFTGFESTSSLVEAVKRAYNSGLLVIVAAGNTEKETKGFDLDIEPVYPVCFDQGLENMIIGVSGTDTLDQKARFSNYGSQCIDISAPATKFFAAQYYDSTYDLVDYYNGYWDGTSVATPLVSGTAALIKSINKSFTNKEIRDIILENTDSIDAINSSYKGKLGTGRLNVEKAVLAALKKEPGFSNEFKVVVSPLAGEKPEIKFFKPDGEEDGSFIAYAESFRGGVNVAVGDVDGDSKNEIIAGAGNGGGPHIRVFDQEGHLENSFFAYDPGFRGGVNVAVGDIDGNGVAEIIAGAGNGGGPHIRVFDSQGNVKSQFFAYAESFRGGVNVAVGDVDGDSKNEIIAGAGNGGGPHVRIFDSQVFLKGHFFAFDESFRGGVNVSAY